MLNIHSLSISRSYCYKQCRNVCTGEQILFCWHVQNECTTEWIPMYYESVTEEIRT